MKQLNSRQRTLAYAAASAVALIAVLGAGFWFSSSPPPIVIRIDPSDRDEISTFGTIKYVYSLDGKTVLEKHIPYSDGGTGHQLFREDGTLRETTEHWPQRDVSSALVLKSKGTWSKDGKRLELGEAYRPDGSLWFTVKDLGDDKREETFYFADGWKFSSSIKKKGESKQLTTYFHRNGNVWAEELHEKTQWGSYNEKTLTVFDPSGKQKLYKVDQVSYNDEIDGFKPGAWGRLITYYNADGKATHRQWCNSYWNSFLGTQGNLILVHVFDTTTGTVKRTIEVEDGGENVKLKTVGEPSGVKRVFRDFGTMKKLSLEKLTVQGQVKERFLVSGTCAYEVDAKGVRTDHEDAERVYENIDLALLTRPTEDDIKERRTASQAENKGVLGPRDDSDPVKWYHKQ